MVLTWFEHVHRFVYAGTQCADIEEVLYSFQSGNVGMSMLLGILLWKELIMLASW